MLLHDGQNCDNNDTKRKFEMEQLREWVGCNFENFEVMVEGQKRMTHKMDYKNMDQGRQFKTRQKKIRAVKGKFRKMGDVEIDESDGSR